MQNPRLTGGFIPPSAPRDPTQDAQNDVRLAYKDQWDALRVRPTIPVNIPSGALSQALMQRPCILMGWSLRETTGTADAQVEFIDGSGVGGPVVGEQGINAPLPGSVGDVFVDVDSTSNTAASANTATLAGAAGATTYITGWELTGLGATSVALLTITVAGVLGGSKIYYVVCPAGVGVAITPTIIEYSRPIPASAVNTAITVGVSSPGAGNTNISVTAHGYQLTLGSTANQAGQTGTADCGDDGVLCRDGLYLRVITGSIVGSAWIRV